MGAYASQGTSTVRLQAVVGLLLAIVTTTRGWAAVGCSPPILAGKWQLRQMTATTRMTGHISAQATTDIDSTVTVTGVPGAATYLVVDCQGNVTGEGEDSMSGTYWSETRGGGGRVTTTTTYTGQERYQVTGTVVGTAGLPVLNLTIHTTSGSLRSDMHQEISMPGYHDVRTGSDTEDLAGQATNETLPVKTYDPDQGVLTVDLSEGAWFQRMQQKADQATGGFPLQITYSGDGTYENTTVSIVSVIPEFRQYFLKGVTADNKMIATVSWLQSPQPHVVTFTYGSNAPVRVDPAGDTVAATFDMGDPADTVIVEASAGGQVGDTYTLTLTKLDVPQWAQPAHLSGSAGIAYNGVLNWPPQPAIMEDFGNLPLVGGAWKVLQAVQNDLEIKAHSEGPPPSDGKLTWRYGFELPFTSRRLELKLDGTTRTTLGGPDAMKMTGDANATFTPLSVDKRVGILSLIPGADTVICGVSQNLCDFINGAGIKGAVAFFLTGNGKYESKGDKVEWTTGSATGTAIASVTVNFIPPPIDALVELSITGLGVACITLRLLPDINVTDIGADLTFIGYASALLVGSKQLQKTWTLSGGCGGAPPPRQGELAPERPRAAGDAIPVDGHPAVNLGSDNWQAIAWTGLTGTNVRPSGDIFVRFVHGTSAVGTMQLTADVAADQAPDVVFTSDGRAVVVWQRNPSPVLPAELVQPRLDEFARGFEIAYAVVDPARLTVLATGTLSDNADLDFGPKLFAGAGGEIMLLWQRATGAEFFGTTDQPLTLMCCFLDGNGWSTPEPAAQGLANVVGVRAALASRDTAMVVLTIDQDGTLVTEADREIVLLPRQNGAWGATRRLTNNAVVDWAPQLAYLPDGRLALAWLQDEQIVGLLGDLTATPQPWVAASGVVGPGFSHARMLASGGRLILVWPAVNDLYWVSLPTSGLCSRGAAVKATAPWPVVGTQNAVESAFAVAPGDLGTLRYTAVATTMRDTPGGSALANTSDVVSGQTGMALTVDLAPGWNLISVPFVPSAAAVADAMASARTENVVDSSASVWRWASGGGQYEPATTLEALRGYWVTAVSGGQLRIAGASAAGGSLPLVEGWNLVGTDRSAEPPQSASLRTPWWRWSAGEGRYLPLESGERLEPGQGYWIYSAEAQALPLGR